MKKLLKFIKILSVVLVVVVVFVAVFYFSDKLLGNNNAENFLTQIQKSFGLNNSNQEELDTRPLEVTINVKDEDTITTYESLISLGLTSNKIISMDESERFNLIPINTDSEIKQYALEVKNIGNGEGAVRFTVKDEIDSTQEFLLKVNKLTFNLPTADGRIAPWPNTSYIVDGDNLVAPMSKSKRLLSTYEPGDLVNLKDNYINMFVNQEDFQLRKEAADNLDIMLNVLRNETGKNVVIASAYRSYNNQVQTYSGWLKSLGQTEADKISARPGYSEHQLGTVVDFFSEDSGFDFTAKFDETVAGKWLLQNAHKFGFIQTYPKNSENLTGYAYEAWHWRYIGVDSATEIKEKGTTYPEWTEGE